MARIFRTPSFQAWEDLALAYIFSEILVNRAKTFIALSGGSTPKDIYRRVGNLLQSCPSLQNRVQFYVVDERNVGLSSQRSNSRMIMESIGESGFSPFDPTVNSPIEYTELLKRDLGQRMVFDLVVLGCGEDGHTASLFTGSELLKVNSEGFHRNQLRNGETRYSLTLDTLTIAKKRLILVGNVPEKHAYFEPTAMKKMQAPVHRILEGDNTHICIHEDL